MAPTGSACGPRAGLGGPPKPSIPSLHFLPRDEVCGTKFSAGRRKQHASGGRSPELGLPGASHPPSLAGE